MLAKRFVTLTVTSTTIGLMVFCIPMNQPLKTKSERVAGAAQILMLKYVLANCSVEGDVSTIKKAVSRYIIWITQMNRAAVRAVPNACTSTRNASRKSLLP